MTGNAAHDFFVIFFFLVALFNYPQRCCVVYFVYLLSQFIRFGENFKNYYPYKPKNDSSDLSHY